MDSTQIKNMPLVSVFMPVYNAGVYLSDAIQSILNQTFKNFEFVILNDGSSDKSAEIIESFSDRRIRFINQQENKGLIASLNTGLEECRGKYIVRMDQDDISLPDRIELQVDFLEKNPEYGLIGSWFEDFGDNINSRLVKYSGDDTHIRIRHLYQTHISHPTAVLRASIIREHALRFDPNFLHGEDYHFWVRMSAYCKLSNYPKVLVRKRDHPTNISNAYAEIQRNTCNRVKQMQFNQMGIDLSDEDLDLYSRFANPEWDFSLTEMESLFNLLEKIHGVNSTSQFINPESYEEYLAEKWFHLCLHNPNLGKKRFLFSQKPSFAKAYSAKLSSRIKLRAKSIFV